MNKDYSKLPTVIQLLTLANNTNQEGEASTAKYKAGVLMEKYGLTMEDVQTFQSDCGFDQAAADKFNREYQMSNPYSNEKMSKFNVIVDFGLRQAINRELKKKDLNEPITIIDIRKVKRLMAANQGITCIEGLQYAPKIKKCDLSGNFIKDIKPLSALTNLRSLDLANNTKINSIAPIMGCQKLEWLSIAETYVSDLLPLRDMKHLKTLNMKKCPYIRDFKVVEYLHSKNLRNINYPGEKDSLFDRLFPIKEGKRSFNKDCLMDLKDFIIKHKMKLIIASAVAIALVVLYTQVSADMFKIICGGAAVAGLLIFLKKGGR